MSYKLRIFCVATIFIAVLHGCGHDVDHAKECDNYLAQAALFANQGDFAHADEMLASAEKESTQSDAIYSKPRVLQTKYQVAVAKNELPTAEKYARQLAETYVAMRAGNKNLAEYERKQLTVDYIRAIVLVGDALYSQKKTEEAATQYELARKGAMAANDLTLEAMANIKYVTALRSCGRGNEADKVDEDIAIDANFDSVGNYDAAKKLRAAKRYPEAIKQLRTARGKLHADDHSDRYAQYSNDLAYLYFITGNTKAALAEAMQAGAHGGESPQSKAKKFTYILLCSPDESQWNYAGREALLSNEDAATDSFVEACRGLPPNSHSVICEACRRAWRSWAGKLRVDQREYLWKNIDAHSRINGLARKQYADWLTEQLRSATFLKRTERTKFAETLAKLDDDKNIEMHQPN